MRTKVIGGVLAVAVVASTGIAMAVAARDGGTPLTLEGLATSAGPAGSATSAGQAMPAGQATSAEQARSAGSAMSAGSATTAARAGTNVDLPGGRWTSIPASPIVGRSDAVGVWTGSQLVVWGGTNPTGSGDYADGAAYNPTTRRWTKLPASPLSARSGAASVWTGHLLFIWGGTGARDHRDTDGALYDPATERWTRLGAAPVPAHSSVQVLWTGTKILLLSMPPGRTSDHLTLQAYDPATRRWAVLPTLHLRTGREGYFATGVMAGNELMVWLHWTHETKTHDGFELASGIDGYRLDPSRPAWALDAFTSPPNDTVDTAFWTGQQVVIPASQLWCGYCPGPYRSDSKGLRVDPTTLAVHTIPHGPADDLGAAYLWTGSVLLAVNTTASSSGPSGQTVNPGRAAYWQPSMNRWTQLPSAPLSGGDAVTVWTGHSLLVWGQLSPSDQTGPTGSHTAGLQLSR